jgi:hypothetical protein
MKYYKLLKNYTHHGGTIVLLNEIPEGTLVQRALVTEDNPGMEYITVGFGDEGQFYLSAEVVENSPTYFEQIDEWEYWKAIATNELLNAVRLAGERGVSPLECVEIINDEFDLELDIMDWDEPNDKLKEAAENFKKFMEGVERVKEESKQKPFQPITQPFVPYQPIPNPYNNQPYCQCGNDGTRPCWSTACPHRLIVTYCSTTTAGSFAGNTQSNCCKLKGNNDNKCSCS